MGRSKRVEGSWDFELEYMPKRAGFSVVRGLRVILVGDRYEDSEEKIQGDSADKRKIESVRVLKGWDVVGEIWVKLLQYSE